jgi:hypothetical protein
LEQVPTTTTAAPAKRSVVEVAWVDARSGTGRGRIPWVQGLEKESCAKACARFGLKCEFEEDNWPVSDADVTRIVNAFNGPRGGLQDISTTGSDRQTCTNFTSSEQTFEPSISGSFCSHGPWKPHCIWGDEIKYRPQNVRSCEAIPPVATRRLCQCTKHRKPLKCSACDDFCWKTEKGCCWKPLDPCAKDPEGGKDPKYWGSALSEPATGVPPDAWCQQGHPKERRVPRVPPYQEGVEANAKNPALRVKVLSYNLYWWNLFKTHHGNMKCRSWVKWCNLPGTAGELVASANADEPFDVMGFQECEDPGRVLYDAKILGNYTVFQGPHATCMAFRNTSWTLLGSNGSAEVAEDGDWVRNNYWSKRTAQWIRLRHKLTNQTLFFMNHHGPLPLHSGGLCGGLATAYNILQLIYSNMESGDAVVLVGDFNANSKSMTIRTLETGLHLAHHGKSFGGVDNFLTNIDLSHVISRDNYGNGGSDHDALGMTIELPKPARNSRPSRIPIG